jgi:hypothetical protein
MIDARSNPIHVCLGDLRSLARNVTEYEFRANVVKQIAYNGLRSARRRMPPVDRGG